MAMTGHVEFEEVFQKLAKEFWFEKPLKRVSTPFKSLLALVASIMTACSSLFHAKSSAVLFDEYAEKYENIVVDEINAQMGSNKPLAQAVPAVGSTDVLAGKTAWQKDPYLQDRTLDTMRTTLTPGAKDTLNWLCEITQDYALYFIKCLIVASFRTSLIKKITEAKASNKVVIWHELKTHIRSRLVQYSPHLLMESLQTMIRPPSVTALSWTTTWVQVRKLLAQKYGQLLVGIIAWHYWAGQITIGEWSVVKDILDMPTTETGKADFNISSFATAAEEQAPEAFTVFDINSLDAVPVKAHQKKLLVKAHHVLKRVWQGKKPKGKKTAAARATAAAIAADVDPEPFFCKDCNKTHAKGEHTEAGRAIFKARFADQKAAKAAKNAASGRGGGRGRGNGGRGRGGGGGRGRGAGGRGRGAGKPKPLKPNPKHADLTCHNCNQKGHIRPNCPKARTGPKAENHAISGRKRGREDDNAGPLTSSMKRRLRNARRKLSKRAEVDACLAAAAAASPAAAAAIEAIKAENHSIEGVAHGASTISSPTAPFPSNPSKPSNSKPETNSKWQTVTRSGKANGTSRRSKSQTSKNKSKARGGKANGTSERSRGPSKGTSKGTSNGRKGASKADNASKKRGRTTSNGQSNKGTSNKRGPQKNGMTNGTPVRGRKSNGTQTKPRASIVHSHVSWANAIESAQVPMPKAWFDAMSGKKTKPTTCTPPDDKSSSRGGGLVRQDLELKIRSRLRPKLKFQIPTVVSCPPLR